MLWQNADANVPRRNADDQGENARSVTVGHQDPIAQPGPVCQIEFQLIHIIGRPAALVASSYRPVSHCRHPELIAWEQAWAGEGVNAAAISKPRVFMPQLLADTNVVPLPISRSSTSRVHRCPGMRGTSVPPTDFGQGAAIQPYNADPSVRYVIMPRGKRTRTYLKTCSPSVAAISVWQTKHRRARTVRRSPLTRSSL